MLTQSAFKYALRICISHFQINVTFNMLYKYTRLGFMSCPSISNGKSKTQGMLNMDTQTNNGMTTNQKMNVRLYFNISFPLNTRNFMFSASSLQSLLEFKPNIWWSCQSNEGPALQNPHSWLKHKSKQQKRDITVNEIIIIITMCVKHLVL